METFIIQVIFALISGVLFIMSDSIIPSIIANITYKSPQMILAIKSYFYHYKLAEDH